MGAMEALMIFHCSRTVFDTFEYTVFFCKIFDVIKVRRRQIMFSYTEVSRVG